MTVKDNDLKIKMFCKIFIELLQDLERLYPLDLSLRVFHQSCNVLIRADPRAFVLQVMEYLQPFTEEILSRNDNFFIEIVSSQFIALNSYISNELQKIRDIWVNPETSPKTKECVWDYFTLLLKLGSKIDPNIKPSTN
jgi:hypothetical protein